MFLDTERPRHLERRLYLPVLEHDCRLAKSPATSLKLSRKGRREEAAFDFAKEMHFPECLNHSLPPGVANCVIVDASPEEFIELRQVWTQFLDEIKGL